jgi:hypothetical protein
MARKRKRKSTNNGPPRQDTWAVVRGSADRPFPQARGMTLSDAQSAARDRSSRPGKSQRSNFRVVSDRALDEQSRGRGGLAGQGDAATRRAKAEERRKRAGTEPGRANAERVER